MPWWIKKQNKAFPCYHHISWQGEVSACKFTSALPPLKNQLIISRKQNTKLSQVPKHWTNKKSNRQKRAVGPLFSRLV